MEEAKEAAERTQAAAASKRAGKKKSAKGKKGVAQEASAAEPSSAHKPSPSAAADAELGGGEERLEGELELAGEGYGAVAAGAGAGGGMTMSAPADLFADLARLVKAQAPPPVPAANAAATVKQEVKTPAAHIHQPPMIGDLLGALVSDKADHLSRLMGVSALAGAIAAPLAVTTAEHGVAGQLMQPISAQMRSPTGASRSALGSAGGVLRSPRLASTSASALHSLHAASSAGGVCATAVGESAPVDDGMFHALKDLLPNDLLSTELKDLHILPHEADSIFDLGFDTLGIEELAKDSRGSLLCTWNANLCFQIYMYLLRTGIRVFLSKSISDHINEMIELLYFDLFVLYEYTYK